MVTDCYEGQLRRNPRLAGKVTLAWTITETGETKEVRITENTTGNAHLAECVRAQLTRLSFSPPDEEIDVDAYPFIFSSR